MATCLPRELWKWIQSMELSTRIRQPRRDFANGFLFAEILWRYFPKEIRMHSFENVTSTERKALNWTLLAKFFRKYEVPLTEQQTKAVMSAQPDAAVALLMELYHWLHGSSSISRSRTASFSNDAPLAKHGSLKKEEAERGVERVDRQDCPHRRLLSAAMNRRSLDANTGRVAKCLPVADRNESRPNRPLETYRQQPVVSQGSCGRQQRRAIDWNAVLQQPDRLFFVGEASETTEILPDHAASCDSQSNDLAPQRSSKANPLSYPWTENASSKSMPALRRSRNDRQRSGFNDYWVLGKLGPNMRDPQLIKKQNAYDRVKEFSAKVNEVNKSIKRRPMETEAVDEMKEVPHRIRALEYSKSIPRPTKRDVTSEQRQKEKADKRVLSELQRLEREHQAHKERMKVIAAQLSRRGG